MKLALMGAGGKMGCRIADNLIKHADASDANNFDVRYVEVSPVGIARLAERKRVPTPRDEALVEADAVVLALPDALLGKITHEIVPLLRSGALVMTLDPAAAYAGVLAIRDDLDYFIAHPCHPPMFNDEVDDAARTDWFGGVHAKQHIVCALHAAKKMPMRMLHFCHQAPEKLSGVRRAGCAIRSGDVRPRLVATLPEGKHTDPFQRNLGATVA